MRFIKRLKEISVRFLRKNNATLHLYPTAKAIQIRKPTEPTAPDHQPANTTLIRYLALAGRLETETKLQYPSQVVHKIRGNMFPPLLVPIFIYILRFILW